MKLQIGRASLLLAKSQPHNKQGWFSSIANGTFVQIEINLKKVVPTFSKFTWTQSVLIFANFAHPCSFLAFLCFFWVLLQFLAIIVIFQLILLPVAQCRNCLKLRDIVPLTGWSRFYIMYGAKSARKPLTIFIMTVSTKKSEASCTSNLSQDKAASFDWEK